MTTFGDDFLWGVATSAYQVEGSPRADGRGESIWDRFCRTPGNVLGGATGDVACEHYLRYAEDVELMRQLGLRAYRFSISWPRVFPEGSDRLNRRGLDFYGRLVDRLLEHEIEPIATLYHWDLPQALHDRGGWESRETAARFADYAATVYAALGDRVTSWITHNEPWVTAFLGYGTGSKAPGIRDWRTAVKVSHHLLLSHGLAAQAMRAIRADGQVGIALDFVPVTPATPAAADIAATRRMDGFRNRWFLDPVARGGYPADVVDELERRFGALDCILAGDLETVAQPLDFLGVNFYTAQSVRDRLGAEPVDAEPLPAERETTAMGWEIVPEALTSLLVRLKREYGDVPLYVTENGAAYDDVLDGGTTVEDPARLAYLRTHVEALRRALEAGVDVHGYFVWSLLDNFEWENGYSKRFGLVYVDFPTQRRVLKSSALFYRDLIAGGGGAGLALSS
jgi:beta-glucosidase